MSAFDLTPRLAREAKSNGKDTILFDKALPGFGLRIHPSGRKVWIVQARIEVRSRRIVIGRHGEIELAEARRRARDMLARIRAGDIFVRYSVYAGCFLGYPTLWVDYSVHGLAIQAIGVFP